jgi:AAA domain
VFQVAHPDLPSAFPPLRSPGRQPILPSALTSFVGRAKEIEEVRGLLGESRLVTLTGVGGNGKTRLALEVAAGVQEDFPDGVYLVELGPLSDPGLVASMVASALGVVATGPGATTDVLVDRLSGYLQPKRTLMILDNCEHVIEAAAELIHALLPNCPGLTVLATSRRTDSRSPAQLPRPHRPGHQPGDPGAAGRGGLAGASPLPPRPRVDQRRGPVGL